MQKPPLKVSRRKPAGRSSRPLPGRRVDSQPPTETAANEHGAGTLPSSDATHGGSLFKKRHPDPGARPGTLVIADDAPQPRIRMMRFDDDELEERDVDATELATIAVGAEHLVWVDVQGFGDESVIRAIGDLFAIHPLAMEDVVNVPQRPKVEAYGEQVLIVTRMIRPTGPSDFDMEQVTVLFGRGYVVTFQERYGDVLDPVRARIRNGRGRPIRTLGADYLTYALVDTIVDGYYPVIEALGDHLEQLEQVVVENPGREVLRELNRTRNMLVNMRRAIWPQREAFNSLIRDDFPQISDEVRLFLRDTYDHTVQTAEVVEMHREIAAGLVNIYLSSIANRTNDVMKVLTIMASVFTPLTFLAGIYGMNFDHMPELHVWWGYPLIWLTMLATGGGMLALFWRKGWLGSTSTTT